MDSLTQDVPQVKKLSDYPILVCTLQRGYFLLDLNSDEPMRPTDYIPFDGQPYYGAELTIRDYYGLEAVA